MATTATLNLGLTGNEVVQAAASVFGADVFDTGPFGGVSTSSVSVASTATLTLAVVGGVATYGEGVYGSGFYGVTTGSGTGASPYGSGRYGESRYGGVAVVRAVTTAPLNLTFSGPASADQMTVFEAVTGVWTFGGTAVETVNPQGTSAVLPLTSTLSAVGGPGPRTTATLGLIATFSAAESPGPKSTGLLALGISGFCTNAHTHPASTAVLALVWDNGYGFGSGVFGSGNFGDPGDETPRAAETAPLGLTLSGTAPWVWDFDARLTVTWSGYLISPATIRPLIISAAMGPAVSVTMSPVQVGAALTPVDADAEILV